MKNIENVQDSPDLRDEQVYPSVDLAFQYVLPSYQMVASRFEAADNRLTSILALTSSLTLAAPIFGKAVNPTISFASPWFAAGMVVFFVSIALGLAGRLFGSLTLPNPMILYRESLHLRPWEFKKDAIYFAGVHFGKNADAVGVKGRAAIALTLLMALEIVVFVVWVARG